MKASQERIILFDTTLRDGEQSPGASMDVHEKVLVAKQLEILGVDKIEAGFPVSSPGDFDAVNAVAQEIQKAVVVGLCRTRQDDIKTAWDAVKDAARPGLHTFIATSDIHLKHKLRMSKEEVLKSVVESVGICHELSPSVEFSAEDATRSSWDFLVDVFSAAIQAGADTINVPDTVGYTNPQEFFNLVSYLKKKVKGIDDVTVSVHCHNDLGLATSNSISACLAGGQADRMHHQRYRREGRQYLFRRGGDDIQCKERSLQSLYRDRYDPDLSNQPPGFSYYRDSGAAEQGDSRCERVCP